jgi:DNA-binding PadR family transcriptional regulator
MVPTVTEQTLFVLACLATGERHGYAIAQEAEALSGGRVRLTAGTLYGALNRLCAQGLVEPTGERVVEGRVRRYYRLTAEGERVLHEEVDQVQATATTLRRRLTAGARLRPA